jgi:hypothetical protein
MMYYTRNGSDTIYDVSRLSKDGQSQSGSLRSVITKVITRNTSYTRIKYIKCSKS